MVLLTGCLVAGYISLLAGIHEETVDSYVPYGLSGEVSDSKESACKERYRGLYAGSVFCNVAEYTICLCPIHINKD